MNVVQSWLQVIFPPLCQSCKAPAQGPLFCSLCWEQCAPPDPKERCPHCFEEGGGLCSGCVKKPLLPFSTAWVFEEADPPRILSRQRPDTLSSFAQMQWAQLNWPRPDVLIPMPEAKKWSLDWACAADWPYADILSKKGDWRCDAEAIEEGLTLLVLDVESSAEDLREVCNALAQAFPKKGFILRLFP